MKVLRPLAFLLACVMLAPELHAQPAQGAIVSGVVGVASNNSNSDVVISVSAGYRFNRVFGLGLELTSVPSLSIDPIFLRFGSSAFDDLSGSMTVFTTNVRLEVPTTSPRVVPYAVAGGGVANVTEGYGAVIAYDVLRTSLVSTPAPIIFPQPTPYFTSTTNLALTAGGGVSILVGGHLSADVDLRYLRLMDNEDRNIGRFGGGVSYRF